MKRALQVLFSVVLVSMLWITVTASLHRGIFDEGADLWPMWWFRATLLDAYFGFLTFFAWVAFKESRVSRRALWFVLIMLLGNIAMSVYMLVELARLRPGEDVRVLLTRRNA